MGTSRFLSFVNYVAIMQEKYYWVLFADDIIAFLCCVYH